MVALKALKTATWVSKRFERIEQVKEFLTSLSDDIALGAKIIAPAYNIDPRFEVVYLEMPE